MIKPSESDMDATELVIEIVRRLTQAREELRLAKARLDELVDARVESQGWAHEVCHAIGQAGGAFGPEAREAWDAWRQEQERLNALLIQPEAG